MSKSFKLINNKKGFVLYLFLVIILLVVYWRLFYSSNELITYMKFQKNEMKKTGIVVDNTELPAFELGFTVQK